MRMLHELYPSISKAYHLTAWPSRAMGVSLVGVRLHRRVRVGTCPACPVCSLTLLSPHSSLHLCLRFLSDSPGPASRAPRDAHLLYRYRALTHTGAREPRGHRTCVVRLRTEELS